MQTKNLIKLLDDAFDQITSQTEQFTATLSSSEAKTDSKRQKRQNQANNVAARLPSAADEADVDEARMLHKNWSSLSSMENSDRLNSFRRKFSEIPIDFRPKCFDFCMLQFCW